MAEVYRTKCRNELAIAVNSWAPLDAICERPQGHTDNHSGKDDNGDWHEWEREDNE